MGYFHTFPRPRQNGAFPSGGTGRLALPPLSPLFQSALYNVEALSSGVLTHLFNTALTCSHVPWACFSSDLSSLFMVTDGQEHCVIRHSFHMRRRERPCPFNTSDPLY